MDFGLPLRDWRLLLIHLRAVFRLGVGRNIQLCMGGISPQIPEMLRKDAEAFSRNVAQSVTQ